MEIVYKITKEIARIGVIAVAVDCFSLKTVLIILQFALYIAKLGVKLIALSLFGFLELLVRSVPNHLYELLFGSELLKQVTTQYLKGCRSHIHHYGKHILYIPPAAIALRIDRRSL